MKKIYLPTTIHPSWSPFFTESIISAINDLEEKIGDNYNPSPCQVLRFSTTDLSKIKIVILGQDPYPQKGVPTGRSFEVQGLTSWLDKFRQSSLRNILRNLYYSYTQELKVLNDIRDEIKNGTFYILPPNRIFDHWESQGVLMLNTSLTCKVGEPGSHQKLWAPITDKLIQFISEYNENACWFLWGKEAQTYKPLIGPRIIYSSNHPMIANPKNPGDFLNNRCFSDTAERLHIDWLGNKIKEGDKQWT